MHRQHRRPRCQTRSRRTRHGIRTIPSPGHLSSVASLHSLVSQRSQSPLTLVLRLLAPRESEGLRMPSRPNDTLRVSDSVLQSHGESVALLKLNALMRSQPKVQFEPDRSGSFLLFYSVESTCGSRCSLCPCGSRSSLPLSIANWALVTAASSSQSREWERGFKPVGTFPPVPHTGTARKRLEPSRAVALVPYHATVGPWRDLQGRMVWGLGTGNQNRDRPDPSNCWGHRPVLTR